MCISSFARSHFLWTSGSPKRVSSRFYRWSFWRCAQCGGGSGQQLDDVAVARLIALAMTAASYFISPRLWSDRGKAAVHQHGRTGEVARLRRREENDRLGDLGRVRGPAQRRRGAQLLQPVAERADGTVGAGGPG